MVFPIVYKRVLNPSVTLMKIEAPLVAQKAKAGQFIILRVNETGERIPLTVAETDPAAGTVTIIFQKVGKTTLLLDTLEVGDALLDFVGPLGRASVSYTHLDVYKRQLYGIIKVGRNAASFLGNTAEEHRLRTALDSVHYIETKYASAPPETFPLKGKPLYGRGRRGWNNTITKSRECA